MSEIPYTRLISSVKRRRKWWAFVTVAAATFTCLSLIWPLSVKSWKTESHIAVSLNKRLGADQEFEKLLGEVVKRHTSAESLSQIVQQYGLLNGVQESESTTGNIGQRIRERLEVVMLDDPYSSQGRTVRVGVEGIGFDGNATEKEKFFVNMLATTLAKDFMTSPLAGILPSDPLPTDDVELLQQRYTSIEVRANGLLAQMKSNLEEASEPFGDAGGLMMLEEGPHGDVAELQQSLTELEQQRDRLALSESDATLELAVIEEQVTDLRSEIERQSLASGSVARPSAFRMASHSVHRAAQPATVGTMVDSLRSTIDDLANVAAEACSAAEMASRTGPAFSVVGVQSRPARPVGAIPTGRHLMLLLLASTAFAAIVSAAYQPFAKRGFESVEEVGKKLNLPVIATLGNAKQGQAATGASKADASRSVQLPVSNQIVGACKWILFCGLMLTIGFCLVNADIRSAFTVSPFHGLAQIVWTLQGN